MINHDIVCYDQNGELKPTQREKLGTLDEWYFFSNVTSPRWKLFIHIFSFQLQFVEANKEQDIFVSNNLYLLAQLEEWLIKG